MDGQARVRAFLRRTTTVRTASIVGASALILGIVMGANAGREEPTQSKAYLTLLTDFEATSDDLSGLTREAESLSDQKAELQSQNAELESENREMRAAQTELERDQERLASEFEALELRLDEIEEREAAVAAAEAEIVNSEPAPVAPAPPATAYFDNCTAARNAGAAPVRTGDPGYGRHLDRDGDGVGCE